MRLANPANFFKQIKNKDIKEYFLFVNDKLKKFSFI